MLSKRARIVLDTLIPPGENPALQAGIFDAGFDAFYADFQKNAIFSMRLGFGAALFLAIWIAPLLLLRIPPITLYRRETRERMLTAMYHSRFYVIRQMLLLLKATVSFCYGADPAVRDAIGFPKQFDAKPNRPGVTS